MNTKLKIDNNNNKKKPTVGHKRIGDGQPLREHYIVNPDRYPIRPTPLDKPNKKK